MEDRLDRTERIIAGARLVLALAGINLVILMPGGAVFDSNAAYTAVILYLLYAIAIVWVVERHPIHIRQVGFITQTVDSLWFSIILLFTQPEQSPFFLFYVFSLITASFRWGFKETLLVNTVNVTMYAVVQIATSNRSLQFHEFLVRPTYLYVLACLLGYLAEHQKRLQKHLVQLSELSRSVGAKGTFLRMLENLMQRLCSSFRAEQCVVVLHDHENQRTVLARVGKDGQDANVHMVELQPQEAYLLLPEMRNRGYLINPHTRLARILGWKDVLVYNFDIGKPEMEQPQKGHQLMSILEAESLLSTPLVFNDQFWGQVYLINRTKGYFSSTDLQYLRLMIAQVAAIIENYRLLKNMQAITVLEEKSRIARDLHDGLVQSLASLDVRLEVCRRLVDCAPEAITKELEDLQKIVKSEHAGLREYMKQLRTASYPDKDLLKAVQKYAQTLEEENGLVVKISFDLEQIHLSAGVSVELYQIIHEGLTNIRKHAGARQALVHLGQDEKAIDLSIADDGRGFPLGSNDEDTPRPPWSIAERTSALNGTLTVKSVPGHGSTLRIRVPLARAREDAVQNGKEWEEDAIPIRGEDSGTGMG